MLQEEDVRTQSVSVVFSGSPVSCTFRFVDSSIYLALTDFQIPCRRYWLNPTYSLVCLEIMFDFNMITIITTVHFYGVGMKEIIYRPRILNGYNIPCWRSASWGRETIVCTKLSIDFKLGLPWSAVAPASSVSGVGGKRGFSVYCPKKSLVNFFIILNSSEENSAVLLKNRTPIKEDSCCQSVALFTLTNHAFLNLWFFHGYWSHDDDTCT